ncbi:hypothetical protein [Formosa sediminum]|nr:hypothetical protein [Formosa sediminum]
MYTSVFIISVTPPYIPAVKRVKQASLVLNKYSFSKNYTTPKLVSVNI